MKQKYNRVLSFFKGKILSFLEKTSYKTKRATAIIQKREQIDRVLNMTEEEFLLDYEDAVARYEHAKLFFGIPLFVFFLTTLWGIIKSVIKVMSLQAEGVYSGNELEVLQTTAMAVLVILTVSVSIVFFAASTHIYVLSKKKIFFEEMKTKRKGK